MDSSGNPRRDDGVAMTRTTKPPSMEWLTMLCSCVVLSTCLSSGLWAQAGSAGNPAAPPSASSAAAPASPQDADTAAKAHDSSYLIGNDDVLAINVWKEPDISRSVPVRSDGRISLPLVGEVQAAGQTPHQLEADIASKLKNYISEPEVTVIVQEIRSQKFNILGMVTRPGEFPLTNSMTVLDAIALAGGFRDFAKQKSIYILRQNPDGTQAHLPFNYKDVVKGKGAEQNVKLRPRDTIVIP
jgi:polysaccharide biosynthesis/export protein